MTHQKLPLDVLLVIMQFVPAPTISAMMRTCYALYHDPRGPGLLLHNGAAISTDDNILQFSDFMFASPASGRFRHLRALTVSWGGFSIEALRALVAILAHPDMKLESLVLHDAEWILGSEDARTRSVHPALIDALSSLVTLKHLGMSSIGKHTHELLDRLPHGLSSVSLAFHSPVGRAYGGAAFDRPDAENPIVRLASWAETLEVLEGTGFDVHPGNVRHNIVYPRVRYIRASTRARGDQIPTFAPYMDAYPNVEHLALTNPYFDTPLGPFQLPDGLPAAARQENRAHLVQSGCWQRLRVVEGTLTELWALGLFRHVRELRLRGAVRATMRDALRELLLELQPGTLALITDASYTSLSCLESVAKLLQNPVALCVRTLEVEIALWPLDRDTNVTDVLDDIFDSLAFLPPQLRTLKLVLKRGQQPYPVHTFTPAFAPHETAGFSPMEHYLRAMDVDDYAQRFMEAVPWLEKATVETLGTRS